MLPVNTVARLCIAATLALALAPWGPARADDEAPGEAFGDWKVEQARAEDGSAICRLASDVEGMAGEAGLVAAADGAMFLSFREDRAQMRDDWVGQSVRVAFADGGHFALPIARLIRSAGTTRRMSTLLARLEQANGTVLRSFYASNSLSLLLPDGSVHDALLTGAGDAAKALSACTQRIREGAGQSNP
jgi:hypothetical protein